MKVKATLRQVMYHLDIWMTNLLYGAFTPTLQKRCVIVAIHTEINQQEETPKFKIWAMSDMPQSRNNTK